MRRTMLLPALSLSRIALTHVRPAVMAVLLTLGCVSSLSAHPQDGPHADVRIAIRDDAVVLTIGLNIVFVDELVDVPREDFNRLHPTEAPATGNSLLE